MQSEQYSSGKLSFVEARPEHIEIIFEVYRDVGTWLHDVKGITGQWDRELPKEDAQNWIESGELHLVQYGCEMVGAVRVSTEKDRLWTDRAGHALYIHSIAVKRGFAGKGLGRQILAWAENTARTNGKQFIRLDCTAANARLRTYYEEVGFKPLGTHPRYRWFALFEREISND